MNLVALSWELTSLGRGTAAARCRGGTHTAIRLRRRRSQRPVHVRASSSSGLVAVADVATSSSSTPAECCRGRATPSTPTSRGAPAEEPPPPLVLGSGHRRTPRCCPGRRLAPSAPAPLLLVAVLAAAGPSAADASPRQPVIAATSRAPIPTTCW